MAIFNFLLGRKLLSMKDYSREGSTLLHTSPDKAGSISTKNNECITTNSLSEDSEKIYFGGKSKTSCMRIEIQISCCFLFEKNSIYSLASF